MTKDRRMEGSDMEVKLKPGAVSYQVSEARAFTYHLKKRDEEDMKDKLRSGAISRVQGPCKWLVSSNWIKKPGQPGKLHTVWDLRKFNSQVVKEIVCFPTGREIFQKLKPDSTVFAILNRTQAYHQCKL